MQHRPIHQTIIVIRNGSLQNQRGIINCSGCRLKICTCGHSIWKLQGFSSTRLSSTRFVNSVFVSNGPSSENWSNAANQKHKLGAKLPVVVYKKLPQSLRSALFAWGYMDCGNLLEPIYEAHVSQRSAFPFLWVH